jgi:2-oxoisovalerate dehydrogenase E1 component
MVPFGRGTVARPGRDLTIVTWGATVQKSLVAAEQLAGEGCSVEVVDLRTIAPWDHDLVCESVQRTSRLVVVHEDTLTAGFGAEVSAFVAEHCFWALDAPVARVTAEDTFVAYEPSLEHAILPQVEDIVTAVRAVAST